LDGRDEACHVRRLVDGDDDVPHGLPSRVPARGNMCFIFKEDLKI
jgi:hypothetical protein